MLELLKNIKHFTRNPLGIIALFITLIYSLATIFFTNSSNFLNENQRWFFVLFIIFFPLIVLFTFFRLVTNHHTKLYSPRDYQDERNFINPYNESEQKKRIEEESKSILEESKKLIDSSEPEKNITNNLNSTDQDSKISYLFSEELVFRKLEKLHNGKLRRNAGLRFFNHRLNVDGVMDLSNKILAIEVKLIKSSYISHYTIESLNKILAIAELINKEWGIITEKKLTIIIVLVFDFDKNKELEKLILNNFNQKIEEKSVSLLFETYYLHDLKKEFGIE